MIMKKNNNQRDMIMKKLYLLTITLLITAGNVFAMQGKKLSFAADTKEETNTPFATAKEYTDAYVACLDGIEKLPNKTLTPASEGEIKTLFTRYSALKQALKSTSKPSGVEITKTDMAHMPVRMGGLAATLNQKYNTAVVDALKIPNFGQAYDYLFAWVKLLRTHLNYSDAPKHLNPIDQYCKAVNTYYEQNKQNAELNQGHIAALAVECHNLETAIKNNNQ